MPGRGTPTSRGGTGWARRTPCASGGNAALRTGPRPPYSLPGEDGSAESPKGGTREFPPRARREDPVPPSPGGRARGVRRDARGGPASDGVLERFGPGVPDQGVREHVDFPVQHLGELMDGQADAVVGYPVLREVVRADAFAAVPGPDQRAAHVRPPGALLLPLEVVQPRTEDLQRLGFVLQLGLLVLARYDQPRGDVGDADRRVRRVHALAAVARGTEHVDAEVVGTDLDVDLLGLRNHLHPDRGGVDPPPRLRGWHPLNPMDAALVLQPAVGAPSLHQDR